MNETERKAYLEQFNRRTHVLGRIVSAITLVLLVGAPFLIGTFLGAMPDMGAVAKGFAAREAEAAIRDAGGTSAMLDLGGNVTVIGAKEDGSPWRVAVKDPRDTGSYLCVLALTDVTLSTSGGYERYFEEDGVRYHHIIDPETGYPADSGLLSVTVVSADHLLADALSTALFVAGPEEALDFWRSRDDFELVLCTGQGELLVTEGLEDVFTFAGAGLISEWASINSIWLPGRNDWKPYVCGCMYFTDTWLGAG